MFAMTTTAYAGSGKTSILHCGVEFGDAEMTYKARSISNNSKGHGKNHIVGSIDSVGTGIRFVGGHGFKKSCEFRRGRHW